MKIELYTPNLNLVYENSIIFMNYCYQSIINLAAYININHLIFLNSFLIFILGACLGSFSNVCIYRLPKNKQIISGRSFCPRCKKKINWFDNLPLISFLSFKWKM